MDQSQPIEDFPFLSLPVEIQLMNWECTWPASMVIEPAYDTYIVDPEFDFGMYDRGLDSIRIVILRPADCLQNYLKDSRYDRSLNDPPLNVYRLPVTLWVSRQSRAYTLQHYQVIHHPQLSCYNFYFNPKRDVVVFTKRYTSEGHGLEEIHGEQLLLVRNVLVNQLMWKNTHEMSLTLKSLEIFGALDCVYILDDLQQLVKDGDKTYRVPDAKVIASHAIQHKAQYEQLVSSSEDADETGKEDKKYCVIDRIQTIDRARSLY